MKTTSFKQDLKAKLRVMQASTALGAIITKYRTSYNIISSLIDDDLLAESVIDAINMAYVDHAQNSEALSPKLNGWIMNRVDNIEFRADSFPEFSFEVFKRTWESTGVLLISDENCDNNIFGSKDVNIMFRAWHDLLHCELNEDFGYMAEARVAFAQAAELPEDWHHERMLIMSEVIAQAAYHEKTGGFVPDQIEFTKRVLTEGKI